MHVIIEADQRYSIPGKDQFRYIKIHLRLRGMGLNKAKEIISRFILLFPRASEPCMNFKWCIIWEEFFGWFYLSTQFFGNSKQSEDSW